MVVYSYAYRRSRISEWEKIARDTARFRRKIELFEKELSRVFNPQHRDYVFYTRNSRIAGNGFYD